MQNCKYSIIIPCFNEENNIGPCIDSIRAQDFSKNGYEIIAVDNGSIDDTVRIIREKRVKLGNAEKKGPAAAKNRGIEIAKGEIIVFLDADCIAGKDWLKNLIKPFENSGVGCVAGEIQGFEPNTHLERFLNMRKHLSQSSNVRHPFLPYAATANAAYRREVFDRVGRFDENLIIGEDADFSWKMQIKTQLELYYNPDAVVFHPQETTIKGLFSQKKRHAYGTVALYKKYRKLWKREKRPIRNIYWEYYSIIRRLFKMLRDYIMKRPVTSEDIYMQAILEAGWKLGLLKGSIAKKVWYI